MAKSKDKKSKTGNEDDLDIDDLDDLGFDDDEFGDEFEDSEGERSPSKVKIAGELGKEAGLSGIEELMKTAARKSLPESYTSSYYDVMDYKDFVQDEIYKSKSKITKSLLGLAKETKKILPFKLKLIDDYIEKYTSEFESARQESEESMRSAAIDSSLTDIFDKQLEITSAIEAKRDTENEVRTKREIASTKISTDLLTSISNNIGLQTAFTTQIAKVYYKKSLELQFKSYFLQADMLKTMRDYYQGFSAQFDSITKNTGLPDFVKLKNTEKLSEVIKQQTFNKMYDNMFTNNKYVANMKNKMSRYIGEKVGNITGAIDDVTSGASMLSMATEGDSLAMPRIAAGLAGSSLGEYIGGKISPKIKDMIKDNKMINAGGHLLDSMATSPATFFQYLRKKTEKAHDKYSGGGGVFDSIMEQVTGGLSGLLSATTPDKVNLNIDSKGARSKEILSHNQPAIFDNKVHRSITDVIPMYLSKILVQTTTIKDLYRTKNYPDKDSGPKDSEELVYNYVDRKLGSMEDFKKSVETKVIKSDRGRNMRTTVDRLYTDLGRGAKGDDKTNKKLLESYLAKSKDVLGDDFNFDNALTKIGTKIPGADTDPEKRQLQTKLDNLQEVIKGNPELAKLLESMKKKYDARTDKDTLTKSYESHFKDTDSPFPIATVRQALIDISKIAGNKFLNNAEDREALEIAQGLTNFVLTTQTDIDAENIISGKAFFYFTKEVLKKDKIRKILGILTSNVKQIENSGNPLHSAMLLSALSILNNSIRNSVDTSPELWQQLHDYSPELFTGKLTVENLVKGKLTQVDDRFDYSDMEDVKSIVKTKPREVKDKLKEEATSRVESIVKASSIFTRAENMTKGAKAALGKVTDTIKFISEGGSPEQIAKRLASSIGDLAKLTREHVTKAYNATTKSADTLTKVFNDYASGKLAEGKTKLVATINKNIENIDALIKTETEHREELIKNYTSVMSKAKDELNIDTESVDAKTEKAIESINKLANIKIDSLKKVREQYSKVSNLISGTDTLDLSSVRDKLAECRNMFMQCKLMYDEESARLSAPV